MPLTLQKLHTTEFASPPGVYFQLEKVLNNEDGTFEEIIQVIENDPPLAARLLKMVNSPSYGLMGKVETISHAVGIIGKENLADLALATAAMAKFDDIPKEVFNMKEVWCHSLACGFAAQLVAKHRNYPQPEQLYVAGMLHDLGQLVVLQNDPELYSEICMNAKNSLDQSLIKAEKEALGFDHAQIGGILLKEWRLPASIYTPVAHHHEPLKAQTCKEESLILHVAEIMAYEVGFGKSSEPALPILHKEARKILNLNLDFVYEVRDQIKERVEEAVCTLF